VIRGAGGRRRKAGAGGRSRRQGQGQGRSQEQEQEGRDRGSGRRPPSTVCVAGWGGNSRRAWQPTDGWRRWVFRPMGI